jgi:hypothetical protein
MPIGLDLGTGLTKVAWSVAESGHPRDDDFHLTAMPTAVLYRGLDSDIPAFSPGGGPHAGGTRCDGFPMLLGDSSYTDVVPDWGNRTPAEAAQGFLRLLLSRKADGDGDLVVAATAGLGQLGEILAAIGEPPRRVLSTAIAAVTYLRHSRPDLSAARRFIVCDLGAGFTSLALVAAGPRATVVTDSVELAGAAAWSDDTAPLASSDGRPDTLAERLVSALARTRGAPFYGRSVDRWRGLEAFLRNRGDWPAALTERSVASWSLGPDPVLRFADLEVTATELLAACAPLADRSGSALRTLLARQQSGSGWSSTTGARIVLLGGLSALRPVRESLLRAAGLDPQAPGAALVDLDAATRLEAAARGAGLLAAGKAWSSERYPHSLRLPVHLVIRGEPRAEHIELAAGAIDYEQPERVLFSAVGEPYEVTVRPGQPPLPVEIVPNGTGTPVPARLVPSAPPPPGQYRIAFGGGPDGLTVVLHSANGQGTHRYVIDTPTD